jgi:hypothetical protein
VEHLALLREGDRRVSIESNSPSINGISKWRWCSIETSKKFASQKLLLQSVTFNNKGAGEALSTWSLQITDEQGKSQSFGPYTEDEVRIPEK